MISYHNFHGLKFFEHFVKTRNKKKISYVLYVKNHIIYILNIYWQKLICNKPNLTKKQTNFWRTFPLFISKGRMYEYITFYYYEREQFELSFFSQLVVRTNIFLVCFSSIFTGEVGCTSSFVWSPIYIIKNAFIAVALSPILELTLFFSSA